MKNLEIIISLALLAAFSVIPAQAAEVKSTQDGGAVYDAGVDGIEIEWTADGSIKRMSSTWRHPVVIPDRPGISKAQIIAEEKAKASIVRYMNQMISSERLVTEVTEDLAVTSSKTSNGKLHMSTEASRKMGESLRETTRSFATGRLRGIVILEKGFNPNTGEAWVTVGMSDKTMAASAKLADSINAASGETLGGWVNSNPVKSNGAFTTDSGFSPQGAEVRRSRIKDW